MLLHPKRKHTLMYKNNQKHIVHWSNCSFSKNVFCLIIRDKATFTPNKCAWLMEQVKQDKTKVVVSRWESVWRQLYTSSSVTIKYILFC